MNQLGHTPSQRSGSGFTLIEVMLAESIAAIGIIAILGLLPGAIRSGRDAADNTLSATVAQEVFSNIRSQPLDAAYFSDGTGPYNLTGGAYTATSPLPFNFDYVGVPTTNAAAFYYKVLISVQQTVNPAPLPIWAIRVAVKWPALSPVASSNVFISYVTPYAQ